VIAGIVLAAGESRRMGQPKQLMVLGLRTMLQQVVDAAASSQLDQVYVVVGHRAEEVKASLAKREVKFIENSNYRDGLGSSVRAGVAALPPDARAAMFLLGDQPFTTSELINQLLERSTADNIVAAALNGRRANPTLFGRKWFHELLRVSGDSGGRTIIEAHPEALVLVETTADLRDVDTPQDVTALS